MASTSDSEQSDWHGFGISGKGMRYEAEWGVAATARSDGVSIDPVAAAIDADDGMKSVGAVTLSGLELTGSGARGVNGDGALVVELGRSHRDEPTVLLVEEEGRYSWVIPEPGARSVELPVEVAPGSRAGLLPIRRIVRFLAVKTAGRLVRRASNSLAGAWDEQRHKNHLRTWTPDDHRNREAPDANLDALLGGPALLVIHGFTGSIHGSFRFEDDVVDGIYRAYAGRTFAFDHPTLARTPAKNAEELGKHLRPGMTLDILAHSRGGLVARELARIAGGLDVVVRSITFVATPNAGTPLGDPDRPMGLIDAVTNLVGAIPGSDGLQMVLELMKDVVLKSALDGLTGLVAMNPADEHLKELNNEAVPKSLVVRSISADYSPVMNAGIVKTAQDRLMDTYFGGVRNDRIVPTLSTIVTDGQFRVPVGQRLVLDSSRSVDHSSFWTNERAVRQLRDWLRPDWPEQPPEPVHVSEAEPLAEVALPPDPVTIAHIATAVKDLPEAARKALEEVLGGPVNKNATAPTHTRPAVVVIPGIMGTHLSRKSNGEIIWIDPLRLARGHFAELVLPPVAEFGEIEAAGLNRTYLPLISQLAAENLDVYLAKFDWRVDIFESGRRLATVLEEVLKGKPKREVHLVAHSMGGLVARAMAVQRPDLWESISRLVMLGTPNSGSFAIPLILTGEETILKTLALVDLRGRPDDLLNVVATFPGVYQMLPGPDFACEGGDDDHAALFDALTWGSSSPVTQRLLDGARKFRDDLGGFVDRDRMVYVAGYGHPTPFRLEVDAPGKFKIGRFLRGDGRVALDLGLIEGANDPYFSTGSHGGLPSAPDVLADISALLKGEPVTKLTTDAPVRRGVAFDKPVMIAAENFDMAYDGGRSRGGETDMGDWRGAELRLGEALRLTVGGGSPQPSRPTVKVSVLNASLEQSTYPVVVGHYAGLPQGGAETFLDKKLAGKNRNGPLHARQQLGQYPERPGSALFVAAPENHRPRGAIVLGLGELGTLTPQNLVIAMMQGVTAYVLDRREHDPDDEAGVRLGVSAVLVGTPGRRGLTIEQCVAALTEGVVLAVARLNDPARGVRIDQLELQLVELFEDAAEEAALAVDRLDEMLSPERQREVQLVTDHRVHEGDGRRGEPPRALTGTSWVRVTASMEPYEEKTPPALRVMKFSVLLRGAQSNLIDQELDLAQIRAYVDEAVRQPGDNSGVSRTLYEMLFPQRAKLDLDRTESLHLLVDEEMAEIPWELLSAAALYTDASPLALRAGILRQLVSENATRERSERPTGRMVLVVGDPPTGTLARLPGARAEAGQVADLFGARGWEVKPMIYGAEEKPERQWMHILDALHAQPYRVVHIAAHGIFEESDDESKRSGVVIGAEPYHRITALNFSQMSVSPDLVFLNCCHLGRLGLFFKEASEETRKAYQQPHRVAASLARQLLRNGVGAVVVAGWAVDDIAASAFATTLYTNMLDGRPFGDAVRSARQAAKAADFGRTNTWGAYQCYGDPDFELGTDQQSTSTRTCLVSAAQLAREFDLLANRAGEVLGASERGWIFEQVEQLRDEGGDLVADGRVLESMGRALSELGKYEAAIKAYEQSLEDGKGLAHVWVIEQLANLRVRLAVRMQRDMEAGDAVDDKIVEEVSKLFLSAQTSLESLDTIAEPTGERHALRGSLYKKWATTRPRAGRKGDLSSATKAYKEAYAEAPKAYHLNNWIQFQALTTGGASVEETTAGQLDKHFVDIKERERTNPSADYWETAGVADTLVTYAVAGLQPEGIADPLDEAKKRYEKAFRLRSTVRQRDSALEHLEDLQRLVPAKRADAYRKVIEKLREIGEKPASG